MRSLNALCFLQSNVPHLALGMRRRLASFISALHPLIEVIARATLCHALSVVLSCYPANKRGVI